MTFAGKTCENNQDIPNYLQNTFIHVLKADSCVIRAPFLVEQLWEKDKQARDKHANLLS